MTTSSGVRRGVGSSLLVTAVAFAGIMTVWNSSAYRQVEEITSSPMEVAVMEADIEDAPVEKEPSLSLWSSLPAEEVANEEMGVSDTIQTWRCSYRECLFQETCLPLPDHAHCIVTSSDARQCDFGFVEAWNGCISSEEYQRRLVLQQKANQPTSIQDTTQQLNQDQQQAATIEAKQQAAALAAAAAATHVQSAPPPADTPPAPDPAPDTTPSDSAVTDTTSSTSSKNQHRRRTRAS